MCFLKSLAKRFFFPGMDENIERRVCPLQSFTPKSSRHGVRHTRKGFFHRAFTWAVPDNHHMNIFDTAQDLQALDTLFWSKPSDIPDDGVSGFGDSPPKRHGFWVKSVVWVEAP